MILDETGRRSKDFQLKIVFLQPPSPPGLNVKRDLAGGFGVADPSPRSDFGHDEGYNTLPYMSLLLCAGCAAAAGYEVSIVDGQVNRYNLKGVIQELSRESADVIVSVVNLPSFYGDVRLLKEIRDTFPGTKVIAVGTTCIPLHREILEFGAAYLVVLGDPEVVLLDLLTHLDHPSTISGVVFKGEDGAVIRTGPPNRIMDLDEIPYPPYHLLEFEKYYHHMFGRDVRYAPVFTSRGCPMGCYYCPYPVGFGERIVYRDPGKVVDEVEFLVKSFRVGGILFRDQTFSLDQHRAQVLCEDIIKRRLGIRFVVETRLDAVNEGLLKTMSKAGCKRIMYGLETGDPELLRSVGKGGMQLDLATLRRNIRTTERLGIEAHVFILIGLNGESPDTIRNTIETIRKIKPLTLQVAVCTPYPGTPLFDQARKNGFLLTEDWSEYTGFNAVMRTERLTHEQLMVARRAMHAAHETSVQYKRKWFQANRFMRRAFRLM